MFVCPQISTVKHLWVDLHDEVDRFVFWQYICHPRFTCQEVRCALGVIRWLINVLWDELPCLLCFKWQKNVLSSPCCRNSHPLCNCLCFPAVRRLRRILSTWTERMFLDRAPCGDKAQSFHTHPDPPEGAECPHSLFFTRPGIHI